ncbi:hypothetical protein ACOSQ3_009994 [Xanthoceras sorbifolium]
MKMSNSGSEQCDHQRDYGTARCARDEGGGIAPVSTATWWRDHRSRRPKNIKKKNWLLAEATKNRKRKERPRERGKKKRKEEEEEEEEKEKRKKRRRKGKEEEEKGKKKKRKKGNVEEKEKGKKKKT